MNEHRSVIVEAPINIALIKYWGKRDVALNLPTNASLSLTLETLDEDETSMRLVTRTKVSLNDEEEDVLFLNGTKKEPSPRTNRCLAFIRSLKKLGPVKIETVNLFPTAAGLASSASGFAALVSALSSLADSPLTEEELSIAARLGSGSACRSLFGGFVAWSAGALPDGSDCLASSIYTSDHWPQLRCLVMISSTEEKTVSSSQGMQRTLLSSALYPERMRILPHRLQSLLEAIKTHDFHAFAKIVMMESNQLHALCLDTFPPLRYLDANAFKVIQLIHEINEREEGKLLAAYTFDAGPNPFIFCLEDNLQYIKGELKRISNNSTILVCGGGPGAKIVNP